MEEGVTLEYICLDICEKYSLDPVVQFDPLPEKVKFKMIAKWHLDREAKARRPT